ncbi:MAG: tetratricopeptide repeat protein [Cytophagales bacterium]|nr:tetratricopeptide repeat protein [Cytophagales bacterium]
MKKWIFILLLISCADSKESKLQKFLLKGNLALKERNFDQASYYYGEAIKVDNCFADAWNNLGTVYFEQQRYDLALENYEKALTCSLILYTHYLTMPIQPMS